MKNLRSFFLCFPAGMALVIFSGGCDNSSGPTGQGSGKALTLQPESLYIGILEVASSKVSGGIKPYTLQWISDTNKVSAFLTDSTLYVGGIAVGRAYVVVRDSPGTSTGTAYVVVDTVAWPVPPGLFFLPSSVALKVGEQVYASVMGGTPPYSIQLSPDPLVATASLVGGSLLITGVGVGTTSVLIKDHSSPSISGVLPITVSSLSHSAVEYR